MHSFKQDPDYSVTSSAPLLDYRAVRDALATSPAPVVVSGISEKEASALQTQAKKILGDGYKVSNLKSRSDSEGRDVVITKVAVA